MDGWYKIVLIRNHIFNDIITKEKLLSDNEVVFQVSKSLEEESITENEELIGDLDVVVTINNTSVDFIDIDTVKNTDNIHIRETYTDRGDFTEAIVVFQRLNK